jgi:hypothetical protein
MMFGSRIDSSDIDPTVNLEPLEKLNNKQQLPPDHPSHKFSKYYRKFKKAQKVLKQHVPPSTAVVCFSILLLCNSSSLMIDY